MQKGCILLFTQHHLIPDRFHPSVLRIDNIGNCIDICVYIVIRVALDGCFYTTNRQHISTNIGERLNYHLHWAQVILSITLASFYIAQVSR